MKKFIIPIKKFIGPWNASKKFKGTQKLPAQKSASTFVKVLDAEKVKASQRAILGDVPEYMGMSSRAIGDMAAESLALKTANKKFFNTLQKGLKRSRARTATGIKTIRQTKPVSKPAVFKAKNKGAMKAYKTANVKSEKVFIGTMDKLTGKSKTSPFKNKTAPTKRPLTSFDGEQGQYVQAMRNMGFDTKDFYYGVPTQGRISKRHANYLDMIAKKKKK